MGTCTARPNFIETAEHCKENITVNDAFFPILGLFRQEGYQHFMFCHGSNLRYCFPNKDFIARQVDSPPQLLLEVRKGQQFQSKSPLTVVVTLQPSGREFRTQPSSSLLPRWYYLVYHTYKPPLEPDVLAELRVEQASGAVEGTLQLGLSELKNQYLVKWFTLSSRDVPAPQLELRLWNVSDPPSFWNMQNENYKKAVGQVVASFRSPI